MQHNYRNKDEALEEMKARLYLKLSQDFEKPEEFDLFTVYRFFLTPKYFIPNMRSDQEKEVMLDAIQAVEGQNYYNNKHKETIEEYQIQIEGRPKMPGFAEFQENLELGDGTNVAHLANLNNAYYNAVNEIEETGSISDDKKMKKLAEIDNQKQEQLLAMEEGIGEIPYNNFKTLNRSGSKKYQKDTNYVKSLRAKKEAEKEQKPFIHQESSGEEKQATSVVKKEIERSRERMEVYKIYESSDEEIEKRTKNEEFPKRQ